MRRRWQRGNDVRLKIDSSAVPYFADAPALVAQDTYTQAYLANMTFLADKVTFHTDSDAGTSYSDGGGNVWRLVVLTSCRERRRCDSGPPCR